MIVKVCGMRESSNIREIESLGIDWMGFIFYPNSKRFVKDVPGYLPSRCRRVGVFVNSDIRDVRHVQEEFGLDLIQLHGDESPEFCKSLRNVLPHDIKIIKILKVTGKESFESLESFTPLVDYFLFETPCMSYGGSGRQFDWDLTMHYKGDVPFLLTGGIGEDDWKRVKEFRHPQFAGIDLNSRFEFRPGLKSAEKLSGFLSNLRGF